jgi:hypothetical protein
VTSSVRRLLVLVATVLVTTALVVGCGTEEILPGDDEFDPTGPSSPSESVVRTLRLAGYPAVVAGNDREGAVVRVTLPPLESAADVEVAWQTALAALSSGHPGADTYIIQLETDRPLLEVRVPGSPGRDAVEADDAALLRREAEFGYLVGDDGPSALPAASFDATDDQIMRYVDAKNRAAGLLGEQGPETDGAEELRAAVADARSAVPGVAAPEVGQDAGMLWAARAMGQLGESQRDGAADLRSRLGAAAGGMSSDEIRQVREWFHVTSAVESEAPYGSVLELAASAADEVARSEIADGPSADAVLVAIDGSSAPIDARAVARFERVESADTSGTGEADFLPDDVVAANGGESAVISYIDDAGVQVVSTEEWLAYDRADGIRYWLAGEGGSVAFTDGSLRGWAYVLEQAALVNASDVGIWYETFPTR